MVLNKEASMLKFYHLGNSNNSTKNRFEEKKFKTEKIIRRLVTTLKYAATERKLAATEKRTSLKSN